MNEGTAAKAPISAERIAESVSAGTARATGEVAAYALGLGDDALILAQRLGEWTADAPELEEEIALANICLDLLGHARSLLTYAGSAWGRTEDDLAYFRDEREYRNRELFEQPRGDFAFTVARQLVASVYFDLLYGRLQHSADPTLAAIAAKAVKEVAYHRDHAALWLRRLGLGTEESHERMQDGLDAVWPFVDELFADDPAQQAAPEGTAVAPESLRTPFATIVTALIAEAGLALPAVAPLRGGGRCGVHSEALGHLLAELQGLARQHPGVEW